MVAYVTDNYTTAYYTTLSISTVWFIFYCSEDFNNDKQLICSHIFKNSALII